MHSSIINKIRILKPRKKTPTCIQNSDTKKFTISNDNCHSSITLQNKNDNLNLPPLEPPVSSENNSEPKEKWVPFYVLNVPKKDLSKDDNTGNSEVKTSIYSLRGKESDCIGTKKYFINLCTQSKSSNTETFIESQANNCSSSSVVSSPQNNTPIMTTKSTRVTRTRIVKVNNSVNCFLCPTKFDSVQEMQNHYLESHKHKKRTISSNSKSVPKKVGNKSATKMKDPLKLSDEESNTGDGEPKCPICSIYFKTKDEVKSHMTNVHCYKCSECHNTFYTLFQFTDHRCAKFIKQKKPKLKKKKIRTIACKDQEKDPLAIPTNKFANTRSKTIPILPKASYPLILKYPEKDRIITKQNQLLRPQTLNTPDSTTNTELLGLQAPTLVQIDPPCTLNNSNKLKKSLLEYSFEELRSKEFNKRKLEEIIKNPNLSINWVQKDKFGSSQNEEFFSCGRCNVLCEDKADYVEHLEECLRLSNVSIAVSPRPAQRILKLKSEIIPNKIIEGTKTTINKMLLKELRNVISDQDLEVFNQDEESDELENGNNSPILNNTLVHPDIKGNISITRIQPIKVFSEVSEFHNFQNKISFSNQLMSHVQVTQSITHSLSSVNPTSMGNINQPMVIIPLNNSSESNKSCSSANTKLDSPDYPNISITDKSNSVTWNFIGSESGAFLKVESPHQTEVGKESNESRSNGNSKIFHLPLSSVVPFPKSKAAIASLVPQNSAYSKERDILESKAEPHSLSPLEDLESGKGSLSSDDCKDNCPSMEFLLDEEIKMEVEDEVVDDRF